MSNSEFGWMWLRNCIDHLHVEVCKGNHDALATMLLGGNHT
jgi:hypothetical protein